MKIIYFSKTIASCDLKVGKCIELNVLMKLREYQRSSHLGHSLTFAQGHLVFRLKTFFFSKTVELFETKYLVKDIGKNLKVDKKKKGKFIQMGLIT